jgi:glycine cleavage system H protein
VTPEDLTYTAEHEWVRATGQTHRIGITDYAQEALGDIVFVTLPAIGTEVQAGQSLGEVESTKSVSDVYAPFAGTVTGTNEALDANPELINSDPYGEGWMVEISIDVAQQGDPLSGPGMLSAADYAALTGQG